MYIFFIFLYTLISKRYMLNLKIYLKSNYLTKKIKLYLLMLFQIESYFDIELNVRLVLLFIGNYINELLLIFILNI